MDHPSQLMFGRRQGEAGLWIRIQWGVWIRIQGQEKKENEEKIQTFILKFL
jgi:hypothetical protein